MISKTFSIQETSHHLTRKISIRRGWKSRLASIRVTSGNEYRELPRQDVRDWGFNNHQHMDMVSVRVRKCIYLLTKWQ
jgi:hypothetical protein